jgi:alkyl hydroperoxide reductase subunit F
VYAERKCLNTVLITEAWGGQSTDSLGIENWIGTKKISGVDLAKSLKEHVEAYKNDTMEIVEGDRVEHIEKTEDHFSVTTKKGSLYKTRTVLVASGASRKKLLVPGADTFEHKGLTYCASCDGPLFAGQDVAVIGGGNAGFETASQLLAYAKSVTLVHRSAEFRADPVTVSTVTKHPHMRVLTNAEPTGVLGETFVTGLAYKTKGGEEEVLPVTGIFVEIGTMPATDIVQGLVELDERGNVKTDPRTGRASLNGIWAAGDVTDTLYHQNNIAAGDAIRAVENIYLFLKTR